MLPEALSRASPLGEGLEEGSSFIVARSRPAWVCCRQVVDHVAHGLFDGGLPVDLRIGSRYAGRS